MFLVQKAKDVMETDISILTADTRLNDFLLLPGHKGAIRHVVVTQDGRVHGVLRINTRMRHQLAKAETGVTLGAVAQKNFTLVRESDAVFDVITRMSRKEAAMALVVASEAGRAPPRPQHIRGIISKEHVADSVAKTVKIYPG
jgi:CIC family chloride channel protein